MNVGEIKFFSTDKGFGFITQDEGGDDMFFHISGWTGRGTEPMQGQRVSYEIGEGKKGPEAKKVTAL